MWESEWRLSKLSAGFDGVVETDNEFWSVCHFNRLSVSLSLCLFLCLSVYFSVSVSMSVSLSLCLYVCMSVRLFLFNFFLLLCVVALNRTFYYIVVLWFIQASRLASMCIVLSAWPIVFCVFISFQVDTLRRKVLLCSIHVSWRKEYEYLCTYSMMSSLGHTNYICMYVHKKLFFAKPSLSTELRWVALRTCPFCASPLHNSSLSLKTMLQRLAFSFHWKFKWQKGQLFTTSIRFCIS
jgi:hypothetical protein